MSNNVSDMDSIEACRGLIASHHVMSLATSSGAGAWSAPVYYYFMDTGFYFFSGVTSRHIRDAIESRGCCAASIFEDQCRFDQIRGVQMSGTIDPVSSATKALQASAGYMRRFKIKIDTPDILNFFKTQYHANLFCFTPVQLFFMDNSKGFGTRQEISL
ncbi:MAG: pyridoxamine 5'-phosphate oxidase family protein [Pseudomonadota bacterium]